MRKLFSLMLIATIILAACNSSKLSFTEIQSVPNEIQDSISSDYTLQRISDGEKNTYIIFQATGTVSADLEVRENILNIKFSSENQQNNELKPYVYKLNHGDAGYDTINVLVNGKETPFDNSTSF